MGGSANLWWAAAVWCLWFPLTLTWSMARDAVIVNVSSLFQHQELVPPPPRHHPPWSCLHSTAIEYHCVSISLCCYSWYSFVLGRWAGDWRGHGRLVVRSPGNRDVKRFAADVCAPESLTAACQRVRSNSTGKHAVFIGCNFSDVC